MKSYNDSDIEASADRTALSGVERDISHLRRIRAIALERQDLEADLRAAVESARVAGWSWAAIAEQLGVSVQAAHKRFAALAS